MEAEMDSHQKEMKAYWEGATTCLEKPEASIKACQEQMKAEIKAGLGWFGSRG
jgi:hypothetical protein